MMSKKKRGEIRRRLEEDKRRREKEEQRIRSMTVFGKPDSGQKPKKEQKPRVVTRPVGYEQWKKDRAKYPSVVMQIKQSQKFASELSPEMQERERKAQEIKEIRKKRVAPLYNKGGYQYLTDETDPKDLGRKNPI